MVEEGVTYRFEPPIQATGIQGEGDDTKRFPNLVFASGTCTKVGTNSNQFSGEAADGKIYKFFAVHEQGGSKIIPLL